MSGTKPCSFINIPDENDENCLFQNARRKRKELAEARAKRATDRIVKNYLKSHALNELSKDSQ